MKYGIWRHENALGNSAEHTVGLAKQIERAKDKLPQIYVETEFQKAYAACIPNVKESDIMFFENLKSMDHTTPDWGGYNNPLLDDIHMPNVYPDFNKHYNASWTYLGLEPDVSLTFPEDSYENKHDLPKGAIVISIREGGTYDKRVDGSWCEPDRFVDPQTFFEVGLHYAEQGYKVARIGDPNQTPFPEHPNITDFALVMNRNMLDDLFLIYYSKVFLSCDSGVWPMAGGMKKNLVLSNVANTSYHYIDWLPPKTTIVLKKGEVNGAFMDNSVEQLKEAVDSFL